MREGMPLDELREGVMQVIGRRMNLRPAAATIALGLAVLMAAQVTWAAPVHVDDVVLFGGGFTQWDAEDGVSACVGVGTDTPVEGGEIDDGVSVDADAFDTGLVLQVGTTPFNDPDNIGNLVGQSLSLGPVSMEGLQVSRTDTAIGSSPTLRTLIKLRNNGAAKTRDVVWDSDLGSDLDTGVRATSSGDATYQLGDRWLVSSDFATDPPGDAAVTHVVFGRSNPREKVVEILFNPNTAGCFVVRFSASVRANSTRYLLFFTEMNRTNAGAAVRAGKFNDPNLNSKLLKGISAGVRNQVLNWDL
jgi:hypothetical protein